MVAMSSSSKFLVCMQNLLRTKSEKILNSRNFVQCCKKFASANVVTPKVKRWQLHSAVCLQRLPVITAKLTELEKNYQSYVNEIEVNQSLLSDYELKTLDDIKKREKAKEESMSETSKKRTFEQSVLTFEEQEAQWKKELEGFPCADRVTTYDKNNDMTTTYRKLDRKLILIVKSQWSDSSKAQWIFPQVCQQDGESMRMAAERAMTTYCGDSLDTIFLGNAPAGYFSYKLPVSKADEYGVKLFFFKAYIQNGDVVKTDKTLEHKWVTIDELHEYLHPGYLESINEFLIEW